MYSSEWGLIMEFIDYFYIGYSVEDKIEHLYNNFGCNLTLHEAPGYQHGIAVHYLDDEIEYLCYYDNDAFELLDGVDAHNKALELGIYG